MQVEPLRPVYTVDEAKDLLDLGNTGIYQLMASGELAFVQVSERRRLIRGEALAAFLEARTVGGTVDDEDDFAAVGETCAPGPHRTSPR